MVHGILWLRCLTIAVQSGCLVALARRRLARCYPAFWVFTLFGILHSVWALGAGNFAGYAEEGTFRWTLVALYGAVAIEACVAQARHFRSLFSFVIGGVVVFAVLSAALGATVCLMGAEVLRDGGPVTVMCSACCLLLILSTAFFRTFPVTMRANVRWHVLLLEILLASAAVAAGLGSAESSGARLAAQLLTAACPPICYALWTIKLIPSGECFLPLSQIPAEVLARLMAAEPRPVRTPQAPRSPSPRAVRTLRWKPDIAPSDADPEI
jgi:diacylglycerol kinase